MKHRPVLISLLLALFALAALPAAAQAASQNGAPAVVINPGGGLNDFGHDGVVSIFNGYNADEDIPVPGAGSFISPISGSENQYFAGQSQWCCWSGLGPNINIDGQLFGEANAASPPFGEGPAVGLPWDSVQVISTGGSAITLPAGSYGTGTGPTGDGTALIRYTMVYDGRTYQMDRAISYTYPNSYYDETYTFTIPAGNPHPVKFYLGGDSSPGGTDVGNGYMRTSPYRSIFSSNPESQVFVGFQETGPTNPFDHWFVGEYETPYETIQLGGDLDDSVATNDHDAGLQFQWTIPSTPGTYTRNARTVLGFNKIFLSGQFQTSPITTSQTSIYRITVESTRFDNQPDGVTFSMTLPEGLEAAGSGSSTCPGSIFAFGNEIGLEDGSINAESSCTVDFAVTGEPGTYDVDDADFYVDDAGTALTPRDGTTELVINEAPSYLLTVNKAGTGAGYVSSDLEGIDCGDFCSETYEENTVVELFAEPDEGSVFAGWSGAGCSGTGSCSVTMSEARTVTATFNVPATYQLTVNKAGTGTGYVYSDPEGIDCGSTCSETYEENMVLELFAEPDEGSVFAGWSGAGCSGTGTCSVTMSQARTVTATFNDPPPPAPKLAVKSKTSTKTLRAGRSFQVTATVSNTGNAEADGVKTCIRIPRGTSVASRGGGTVANGKVCWTVPALGAGNRRSYSASFRTFKSTTGSVRAGASASASNAASASDSGNGSATVRVLPVRKPKPKPPTG